jgi:hypothetical protein
MEKAEVAHFLQALRQDMLEEAAEKLHDVEVGGAQASTAHFPVGKGDRAVFERDDAVVGDGYLKDIGSEIGKGRVAMGIGLTVDVPGDGPDLRLNLPQETGMVHLVFEEGTVDGGERFDGDKEIGAGGAPTRAILGEATAWNDIVDVGMILELPAPGCVAGPTLWRTPVNPGRSVPMKRSSWASRLRAVAEA